MLKVIEKLKENWMAYERCTSRFKVDAFLVFIEVFKNYLK